MVAVEGVTDGEDNIKSAHWAAFTAAAGRGFPIVTAVQEEYLRHPAHRYSLPNPLHAKRHMALLLSKTSYQDPLENLPVVLLKY